MTSLKYAIFILATILIVACRHNNSTSRENKIDNNEIANQIDTLQQNADSVQLMTPDQFTPLSFLNAAVIKNDNDTLINVITMMDEFPVDWVKESDIDTLITLINSTRKCKCYFNPLSSYIPIKMNAELGGYAIIFINSFRLKAKITLGQYSCPKTDEGSVNEITKWWANYKLKK